MATKEEKITEMAKLLASGAITTEEFTRIIDALNGEVGQIEAQDEVVEDSPTPFELEYIRVMEYYMTQQISPATSHYPSLSNCTVDGNTMWSSVYRKVPCLRLFNTDELHVIHSYIDGQNHYGAVLRDNVDIVFDDKHRIILSIRDGDTDIDGKLNITLQYPNAYPNEEKDDSIESELYEKYMRDKFGEDCVFIPFNTNMLSEGDFQLLDGPNGFLAELSGKNRYVPGHVNFIVTAMSNISRFVVNSVVIVLDSFSNFNLIRIFYAGITISDGKINIRNDEGKYYPWEIGDSPSTVKALAEAAEQAAAAQAAEIDKPVDNPIQLLLEQVDYDKLESSYNAHMQNLIATTYKRYKDCSYPPFDKSMLTVSEGLKKKTYRYEIKTKILLSSSKKLPYSIYLKNLDTYEFGIFPTTIKS